MSAYSVVDSFSFSASTVMLSGTVTTCLASLEDLMLNVTWRSSPVDASSDIVTLARGW